ncbi:MAG TPA: LuxR C-terminal-related transcriptional regulator [Chondromyces sp.]|nr:LuxR C-terminal-related transcriptional regulator [Chondromyces sp.]
MMNQAAYEYVTKIAAVSDLKKKVELMLRGCLYFFPFNRASIFTYSPLSHTAEGIFLLNQSTLVPIDEIKEDIRAIFPLYQALTRNKPAFINREEILESFPNKYARDLEKSMAIIPIHLLNIVVGFALVDNYKGEYPFQKNYLSYLSHYFNSPFLPIPEKNSLSKRETEVLQHLANGYSMKEMVSLLSVSEFTIRDYISSAMRKLGVNHRAEAVAVGIRKGIIL